MEMPSAELLDMVSCPICFEELNEPKALSCLHTFCKECIQSVIMSSVKQESKTSFSCPICRQNIIGPAGVEPEGWAETFPTNHMIRNLQDSFRNESPKSPCAFHTGTEAEFYCSDHVCAICSMCLIAEHRQCHSVDTIKKVAENTRAKEKEFDVRIKVLAEMLRQNRGRRYRVQSRLSSIQADVGNWGKELVEMVTKLEMDIKEQVKSAAATEIGKIEEDIEYGQQVIENLANAKDVLFGGDQSDRQILEARSRINDVLVGAGDATKAFENSNNPLEIQFHPNHTLKAKLAKIGGIGVLVTKRKENDVPTPTTTAKKEAKHITFSKASGRNIPEKSVQETDNTPTLNVNAPSSHSEIHGVLEENRKCMMLRREHAPTSNVFSKFSVRTTKDKNDCLITGTTFLPDGSLVVADHNNGKIKFFNHEFELLSEMGFSSDPWDVSYAGGDQIAVSFPDDNLVQFFKIKTGRVVGSVGNIKTDNRCYGIDIREQKMAVTSRNRKDYSVHVLSLIDGNVIGTWKKEKTSSASVGGLWYVAFNDTADVLYVTNDVENQLVQLAHDGDTLCEIHTCQFFCGFRPRGVSVSGTNVVVTSPVCDNTSVHTSSVKVSTSRGNVVTIDRNTQRMFISQSTGTEEDNLCIISSLPLQNGVP